MDTHIIETREFTWKVHNFTNELIKSNKYAYSENFSIFLGGDETKWCFSFQSLNGNCAVHFYLKDTEADDFVVKLDFSIRKLTNEKMFTKHFVKTRNEFFSKPNAWGWNNIVPIDTICKDAHLYLKDNTLTLCMKVEVTRKKESESVNTQYGNQQYLKMCKEYFDTKSLSDFTIVCSDGIELQAHKFILAAFSPVLKAMINTKMTETKKSSVNIKDINGETMTEILRFIYTTEVNSLKELAVKLLYGAEKYELNKLKKLCVTSMIENLSVDNALDYFLLADKYNSKALLFRSAVFIKLNYKAIRDKDWSKFSKKQFLTLMDNFQHIPGEVTVLESTL